MAQTVQSAEPRVRPPDAAEFGSSQVAPVRGKTDDRFLSSAHMGLWPAKADEKLREPRGFPWVLGRFFDPVKRRALAEARQTTKTDRLSYQACATNSPSGGSAHFPQRAENAG